MPPNKKRKEARAQIPLQCEFSRCADVCDGMENFSRHVSKHCELMKNQLESISENEGKCSHFVLVPEALHSPS